MTEQLIYKLKTQIYESYSIEKELVSLLKENEFLDVNFLENVKILQNNHNRIGEKYPLLDENFYFFILENEKKKFYNWFKKFNRQPNYMTFLILD